jgi:hypothetical protein
LSGIRKYVAEIPLSFKVMKIETENFQKSSQLDFFAKIKNSPNFPKFLEVGKFPGRAITVTKT